MNKIFISFCTTCHNRCFQLRQTFTRNAALIQEHADVEWLILNYCSSDALDEFMFAELPNVCSRVIYARDPTPRAWHLSVAKNMVHRLASGRILVSLDCDNFIGPAIDVIRAHCQGETKFVHMWSGTFGDGSCGRVAMTRELFMELGGYDESFYPMGFQDLDILQRALLTGSQGHQCPSPAGIAIRNTKEEGILYCRLNGLTWNDYDRLNREKSRANILAGRYRANDVREWGTSGAEMYRGQLIPPAPIANLANA